MENEPKDLCEFYIEGLCHCMVKCKRREKSEARKSTRDYKLVKDYLNKEDNWKIRDRYGFIVLSVLVILLFIVWMFM